MLEPSPNAKVNHVGECFYANTTGKNMVNTKDNRVGGSFCQRKARAHQNRYECLISNLWDISEKFEMKKVG